MLSKYASLAAVCDPAAAAELGAQLPRASGLSAAELDSLENTNIGGFKLRVKVQPLSSCGLGYWLISCDASWVLWRTQTLVGWAGCVMAVNLLMLPFAAATLWWMCSTHRRVCRGSVHTGEHQW